MEEIARILELLRNESFFADYAIGGGVATLYFTEPFATVDVDVFALFPTTSGLIDLSGLYRRLQELGCQVVGQYVRIGDRPIQFLAPPSALEEEALREAVTRTDAGGVVKVFRPEYLAAIYVKVFRPKDRPKIQMLMAANEFDNEKFHQILRKHGLMEQWTRYQQSNS
jgi:hypothetical protein